MRFNKEEMAFIRNAGNSRTDANKHKQDIADYDHKRFDLTSRQANVLGVAAEAAWFKHLGGDILDHSLEDWAHYVPNDHPQYRALLSRQDLFNTYEVRRAHRMGNPIPVRRKDSNIILQAHVPHLAAGTTMMWDKVILTGWCKVTDEGKTPPWSTTAKVVKPRPVRELEVVQYV